MMKHWPRIALLAGIGISFVVTFFAEDQVDPYALNILMLMGINIILAVSLNLVNGHTGQFSLGHAGFMAVGAYASAALTMYTDLGKTLPGWALFPLALLVGGLAAALSGLIVGVPSLRLKGDYLAIVTLGFGEIIRVIIQNTEAIGGPRGISGIPSYTNFFWTFALATITIYSVACLVESTYGRGFLAVRDDEVAAEAMGINITKYKVNAFVIGAFFAGIAGGLFAHYFQYITPEGFNFQRSVDVVIMVILGGMGSTVGVTLAAVVITLLNEFLRSAEQYRMIIFSLLLVVMMILRPQGLIGDVGWFRRGRRAKQ